MAHFPLSPTLLLLLLLLFLSTSTTSSALCRSSCGPTPISFPFGIDDGCGHPSFRRLLSCHVSPSPLLLLRTPSGSYPVLSLSYSSSSPHLVVSDPSAWSCHASPFSDYTRRAPPFSLDSSTPLSLSPANDFLFLNCSPESVIIRPEPASCTRYPARCDPSCDSAAYLCRNPPGCPGALAESGTICCAYRPTASESLRLMMAHCDSYAGVYWRAVGGVRTYEDQVAEYGIRVDFEIPVTTRCRQCREKGGGTCGFDTESASFLCLCDEGNVTTFCGDGASRHKASVGIIAGTTTVVSVAGVSSAGALIWYLRKMRTNRVACGVQTNENRLF